MIFGTIFALIAVVGLATCAAALTEFKQKGGLGEEGNKSAAVFAIVFAAGVTVVFAMLAISRFFDSI